jgi:hypothetical protein
MNLDFLFPVIKGRHPEIIKSIDEKDGFIMDIPFDNPVVC